MYVLSNWNGYRRGYEFMEKTFYSAHHLGTDILCPSGTLVYAPFDGVSSYGSFPDGGNVINFACTVSGQKYVMRFMHLSRFVKFGSVRAGEIIGVSGNTGLSTAPHLHVDISRNAVNVNNLSNFVDPDKFNWQVTNGGKMTLADVRLQDIGVAEFNKLHDLANGEWEGWTASNFPNSYNDWKVAYGGTTPMNKILTIMWVEHAQLKKKRYDLREAFAVLPKYKEDLKKCQASGGSTVDKAGIRSHANSILKLAK